jgi:hypothetical protein
MHAVSFTSTPSIQDLGNFRRMEPVEQDHNKKHETRIKDVQVGLVSEQVTVEALQILHGPEDRSHHDKEASNVQSKHVFLPRKTA